MFKKKNVVFLCLDQKQNVIPPLVLSYSEPAEFINVHVLSRYLSATLMCWIHKLDLNLLTSSWAADTCQKEERSTVEARKTAPMWIGFLE